MSHRIFYCLSVLGLLSLSHLSHANPTNGYCQSVDPSVCGWGGNSAPVQRYWYAAIAYDPDTQIWGYAYATNPDLAKLTATKTCREIETEEPRSFLAKRTSCGKKVASAIGYTTQDAPIVVTKGELENGKIQMNLRYGKGGQHNFWGQRAYSEQNIKDAAMDACINKYKLSNCKIVYERNLSVIVN
ncbi:DUF4189 domain-containing protein [Acinetobacter tianfuensis]|uniref:DUF4189 domain-containing protein n=1 Tax=Acinetobacter tianfuensis TaxID=2419603 RepID=A0A3A8ENI1_9GAMM|nr:DUF4189 domain-containing protein [Acinetobacter tianfuensis]RKG32300.1 DUF4189 domain-containing protein [Acinetobacter tianfuensis]